MNNSSLPAKTFNVGAMVKIINPQYVFNGYCGKIVSNKTSSGAWKVILERDENGDKPDTQYLVDVQENNLELSVGDESFVNNLHRRYMRIRIEAIMDCLDAIKVAPNLKDARDTLANYLKKNVAHGYSDTQAGFVDINRRLNPSVLQMSDLIKALPKIIL